MSSDRLSCETDRSIIAACGFQMRQEKKSQMLTHYIHKQDEVKQRKCKNVILSSIRLPILVALLARENLLQLTKNIQNKSFEVRPFWV